MNAKTATPPRSVFRIVHAYELQEPRASMHRRRLARASETGCAAHTENNQ